MGDDFGDFGDGGGFDDGGNGGDDGYGDGDDQGDDQDDQGDDDQGMIRTTSRTTKTINKAAARIKTAAIRTWMISLPPTKTCRRSMTTSTAAPTIFPTPTLPTSKTIRATGPRTIIRNQPRISSAITSFSATR